MPRIFVIDDEPDMLKLIGMALCAHSVETFERPGVALKAIEAKRPDLILLDLGLPGSMDGWGMLRKVKKAEFSKSVPVIVLSGQYQTHQDIVRGLKAGAEDYILKPFHPDVLLAKVEAFLRRVGMLKARVTRHQRLIPIVLGPLCVDPLKRAVFLRKKPVTITHMEFDLLYYLARHAGKTIPAKTLLVDVWKTDPELKTRTVQAHIDNLRRKLHPIADKIETLPAQGYRLSL